MSRATCNMYHLNLHFFGGLCYELPADFKKHYFQICAHEGQEEASEWLTKAKAEAEGRKAADRDIMDAIEKRKVSVEKQVAVHESKALKYSAYMKALESSPDGSRGQYPEGDPCPSCKEKCPDATEENGTIVQKDKKGKEYAGCSTFVPGKKKQRCGFYRLPSDL
ncbi:unnamed protein product [Symbiodinium natans]|uniref:Uncharacterized protein n=1 Tax=Symbiodinium natans TaxID=878477 RepID=A0A812LGB4_9DINO|nr:unnamed protein product [Symbiodinium natans]